MMYYRNIFKIFIKEEKKILGRWNINYNKKDLDYKVYLANYDHCGPCGKFFPKYRPKYFSMTLEEIISEKNKLSLHRLIPNKY